MLTEVARYVKEILANTSSDLDQVTIEPDGRWRVHSAQKGTSTQKARRNARISADDDDDDDDLEISEVSIIGGRKLDTPSRLLPNVTTPTARDGSSSQRGLGSISGKRPAPHDVVDLTLSSDDDDAPPPPKKHQMAPPYMPHQRLF